MKSELLAKSPLLALPLGALFFFFLVFVAVVVITMWRKAPAYDPVARLPIDDDPQRPTTTPTEDATREHR